LATSTTTGAVYGVGTYGTSRYGQVGVIVVPDGVVGTLHPEPGFVVRANGLHVIVDVNDFEMVGSVGSVAVRLGVTVPVTGVVGTGQVGSTTVVAKALVSPTGVEGTTAVGSVTVKLNATVSVTGVSSSGSIGQTTVVGKASVLPTGVEGTGQVNTVVANSENRIYPTGVSATGEVGADSVVSGASNFTVTGEEMLGITGDAEAAINIAALVSGVSATTSLGTIAVFENEVEVPDSSFATGIAGTVTITTTSFNYGAVADQYDRKRTVFVSRQTTASDRTILVPYVPRVVYVSRKTTSSERTQLAA
jgi:hypothetical protein